MNIEEARRILWLKSNPRPLGELLDEGYLTKDRLEWAAAWAYNARLKQAAQVLLDCMNQPASAIVEQETAQPDTKETSAAIEIPISLEKAWTTLWPFAPYKGQRMGELAEAKQLSLKDLGYAIENAWDEKVRQAAIALTLLRLNQVVKEPPPPAGFVHVVSGGRSYAERRESLLTLWQGIVTGWTIILFFALLWWLIASALRPRSNGVPIEQFLASPLQLLGIILVFITVLVVGFILASIPDQISQRLDRQIEEHRLGQEGEDNVIQLMVQALDGNWHLFRNLTIPGRNKADLDIVMVGPPGVWVLEVKNFRGMYRHRGETWEYKHKGSWRPAPKNPSRQAYNNSLRLANFFKADGLNVYVTPAVVWASVTSPLHVENPAVAVWKYNRMADEIGNIWQGEKLSEKERKKIVEKLAKLCEIQRNSSR